jgi:hypothetical protein
MLHQCTALGNTIREYNLFYDSILNDGRVKNWSQELVSEELDKRYGPYNELNPMAPYMPYEYQLTWARQNSQKKPSKWINKIPFFGSNEELMDKAHDSLVILAKELISSESLERRILDKLFHLPDNKIEIIPCS